ncbi:MAG: polyphosphate kinase 1 [Woeseia sp.]|nr:polyphosphate kinase 1 [Woeseia sp.]NNE62048.1 polyphosphate kinase 1 [Woeseia sp.]NNL53659.1 polyphosphate kinase 1 [Woeseia sp.]
MELLYLGGLMSVIPIKSDSNESAAPDGEQVPGAAWDLDDPSLYLNRELTWLAFNRRVLAEAEDDRNPLLERVKFLSIFDSNLDEFFMKRIGGLKHLARAGLSSPTIDGRTPQEQISQCESQVAEALADRAYIIKELLRLMGEEGIHVDSYENLDEDMRNKLRKRYRTSVVPLITPLAIDEAHPFPFVSNMSINLLLRVHDETEKEPHLIRIKVPISERTPRFLRIDGEDRFVALEEVIANNLDLLLPGATILSLGFFRVTRNAIVERDEESANDLLEMIEAELRERRFAPVVRLEVSPNLSNDLQQYLAKELGLSHREDIYVVPDLFGARDLMQLAGIDRPDLKFSRFEPASHPRLVNSPSIMAELDERGPILLKHPYQSFDNSVTRLLREAVADPFVLGIKTTVYRTSEDSAIVPLLVEAVTRGKQVAVVVELQARFDEAANIRWANRLEEAGIHVSYGVVGYKTHAKVTLIVRQKKSGKLRRYVHLGTGNYHAVTARQYCDLGLMISDKYIGADTSELFNLLTSGSLSGRRYRDMLVSPLGMKRALIKKIRRETRFQKKNNNGHIQLKTNALEDADITRELYKATRAGVKVDLIVRDSCRLRPGLPGLSESARVISILGRFLEHSRLYYFHNDGDEEYFIGSADLMTRNLVSRVEALAPIKDPALQKELREILDLQLADTVGAWEMDNAGVYRRLAPAKDAIHSQFEQIALSSTRASAPAPE